MRPLLKLFFSFCAVAASTAFAERPGSYSVSERELGHLESGIQSVESAVDQLERALAGRGRPPRSGFDAEIREIKGLLSGRNGIAAWPERVRQNGGGFRPPRLETLQVKGFFVVGLVDSRDRSQSSQSHAQQCAALDTYLRGLVGNAYDLFECGSTSNVTQYPTIGYHQLASAPVLTIRHPRASALRTVATSTITGSTDSKDAGAAYASWVRQCQQVLSAEKQKYGARFVAGSCGTPRNVTRYPTIDYKQYESVGSAYVE